MRPPQAPSAKACFEEAGVTADQIEAMNIIRRDAIDALKEAESREEARGIIEELRETINALLTPEQLEAIKECLRPERPVTCMDHIDLTPVQMEAIDAIRQQAMEAIKEAETHQEARDIIEQMHQAIEAQLTAEQLAALRECLRPDKPVNCMDQVGLTEEQIAAMDTIRQDAMAAVKEAETRREICQIMDQMHDDLMAVLTDDQLEALQECRDAQRRRHGKQ